MQPSLLRQIVTTMRTMCDVTARKHHEVGELCRELTTNNSADTCVRTLLALMATGTELRHEVLCSEYSRHYNGLFQVFYAATVAPARGLKSTDIKTCSHADSTGRTVARGCCHDYIDMVLRHARGEAKIFRCPLPGCNTAFAELSKLHSHQFSCVQKWAGGDRRLPAPMLHHNLSQAAESLSSLFLYREIPLKGKRRFCNQSGPDSANGRPKKRPRSFARLMEQRDETIREYSMGPYKCKFDWCTNALCAYIDLLNHPKDPSEWTHARDTISQFGPEVATLCLAAIGNLDVQLTAFLKKLDHALVAPIDKSDSLVSALAFPSASDLGAHLHSAHLLCIHGDCVEGDNVSRAMRRALNVISMPLSDTEKRCVWAKTTQALCPSVLVGAMHLTDCPRGLADTMYRVICGISTTSTTTSYPSAPVVSIALMLLFLPPTKSDIVAMSYVRNLSSLVASEARTAAGAWQGLCEFHEILEQLCSRVGTELPSLVLGHAEQTRADSLAEWWQTPLVQTIAWQCFDGLQSVARCLRYAVMAAVPTTMKGYAENWMSHVADERRVHDPLGILQANMYTLTLRVMNDHAMSLRIHTPGVRALAMAARRTSSTMLIAAPDPKQAAIKQFLQVLEPLCSGTPIMQDWLTTRYKIGELIRTHGKYTRGDPSSVVVWRRQLSKLSVALRPSNCFTLPASVLDRFVALHTHPIFFLLPSAANGKHHRLRAAIAIAAEDKPMHLIVSETTESITRRPPVHTAHTALRALILAVQTKFDIWHDL